MYIDMNLFQYGPIPSNAVSGTYDYSLVTLSFFIAVLASYIALDLAGRLRSEIKNTLKVSWLIGGAVVMGTSIWSMHFIGMLAFTLPIPMYFDMFWTIASLIIAILSSGFALFMVRNEMQSNTRLVLAGIFLGLGIVTMHYTGMEAMEINIDILYFRGLFLLSVIIAIVASEIALWLLLQSNRGSIQQQMRLKILGALVMGAAICGMHYTGMASAVFIPRIENIPGATYLIEHHGLTPYVALITGAVIGIALIFSNYRQLVLLSTALENTHAMQNQLVQSEKMAMVGQLAAGVAHEVNNPISWILGNLNYLNDNLGKLRERRSPALENNILKFEEVITESIHGGMRIRDIVRDLKVFSRTDSIIEQIVNIHDILDSAINMAMPSFKYRVTIEKNFCDYLPQLMANNGKLHQVFLNMIVNAAQSMNEEDLQSNKIMITTRCENSLIQIDISDTGSGIPKEILTRIFEPFFTTKPLGEGTGLGLSICYEIIRKLGGKITVDSTVGVGTTFSIYLPVKN